MRRKVILLGPLPPPYGGVSVFMDAAFERLKADGARMWALFGDASAPDPRLRLVRHRRFGIIPALLSEGRGARILDATHFHLEYPNKFLLPVWLAARRALGFEWIKIVLDGSLPTRHARFGRLRRKLFGMAVGSVDEFVVVHEDLRRWLQDEIKVRQRVTVIPCLLPVPRKSFDAPLAPGTESALAAYLKRPRRVCSVGVFIREYGFGDAARAVELLREASGEDIGLALLDGTFARDEDYRAETLRGRDWITVLENVPNPQVYQILKRGDAFVRAFGLESYGISRVEALWCGVPVVATRAGETRGLLLYDYGDAAALAAQLRLALASPPRAEIRSWAETYRREAEENLAALRRVAFAE
ncbi:MAG: glycosyltransferase [Acidobacteria bacterium]|nr:glycosyltransferase [Acidobacteriota bacterium]